MMNKNVFFDLNHLNDLKRFFPQLPVTKAVLFPKFLMRFELCLRNLALIEGNKVVDARKNEVPFLFIDLPGLQ